MKAYTDLEQSKKLSEFLPIETADMFYRNNGIDVKLMWEHNVSKVESPCWSLAALLDIIRKAIGYTLEATYDKNPKVFIVCELGDKPYSIESTEYDNEVDACYEMILNLHELHLL